jgi:hypothetical protein
MPDGVRPSEPRIINADDPEELDRTARELRVSKKLLAEAVEKVGCNKTAIELWLTAPRPGN